MENKQDNNCYKNKIEYEKAFPFLLKPTGKDYLWGGTRLNEDFDKGIALDPLAETWECSTHPDGPSYCDSGVFKGKTLAEILELHPEYLGSHPMTIEQSGTRLPILMKLIDAKKDLSVQVHPDDTYARAHENGSLGKTEMWYVLDASEDASLIYGFQRDVDRELIKNSLANGTIERYLQKVPIKRNDIFFIPAGQVHAIGAGALIAEVQESSNITYRLYDYNRVDKEGKKRKLHIDKSLAVMNYQASTSPRQPMRVLRFKKGYATELLCRCEYFQVERMLLNTTLHEEVAAFRAQENSFKVLLCVEGAGRVVYGEKAKDVIVFKKGDCIFVPADSVEMKLYGTAQILVVCC